MHADTPNGPVASSDDGGPADVFSTQELFREVNEKASAVSSEFGPELLDVFCECVAGCLEHLDVPPAGYEEVRRFPTRFLIKPEHVALELERIVDRPDGYVVVEKIGPAAAAAIRLDPRRRPARTGDGQ